jgi:hypothetical protein
MKLYAQATINISGFRYWFTQKEIAALNQRNRAFEAPCTEEQLIMRYYDFPNSSDEGVWLTSTAILEKINAGIKKPLSNVKIGRVMKKMGFESIKTRIGMSYHVVPLKLIDIETVEKQMPVEETDKPF